MSVAPHTIGKALRALRLSKGMSQEALAAGAGISRTTLIQIEKGKDAQVSSMDLVAHILGAGLGLVSEPPDMAMRRQARSELQAKQAASREKHLKIAVKFALAGDEAVALRESATRMLDLWAQRELCSSAYIARWQAILAGDLRQVAQNILAMDEEWGPALRQNTPFAVLRHEG